MDISYHKQAPALNIAEETGEARKELGIPACLTMGFLIFISCL